ncbi:MAG: ArsR/SmtB family transcription factor [Pseudomonadota bacterium]
MTLKRLAASRAARSAGADQVADESERLARMFRALSNPNRLQIYTEILRRQRSALGPEHSCALYDFINSLEIGAPTVSHHIKELVNAGLIAVERDGKYLACTLDERARRTLRDFFAGPA